MSDIGPGTTGEATGNVLGNGTDSGASSDFIPQNNVVQFESQPRPEDQPVRRITRSMAQQLLVVQREPVPFWLDHMGFEAQVLPLSFADKVMMSGIDPRLQSEISGGINSRSVTRAGGNVTFADMLRGIGNEERIANALCVAGFRHPILTLTKEEADRAGNEDVWWVNEVHIDDRRKYSGFVLGQDEAEVKRISNFLLDRVAPTGNS